MKVAEGEELVVVVVAEWLTQAVVAGERSEVHHHVPYSCRVAAVSTSYYC